MAEIYARGPVAAQLNAEPLVNYHGGWGEYWGEMGFARVHMGHNCIGIESEVVWATPHTWTERNYPCDEDGKNCDTTNSTNTMTTKYYVDPSSRTTQ